MTKEAELKEEIERLFDKYREEWYSTNNQEIAMLRYNLSKLIFGNDGIFEVLDELQKLNQEKEK